MAAISPPIPNDGGRGEQFNGLPGF